MKYLSYSILLFALSQFLFCRITDPDFYYNDGPQPPQIQEFDISDIPDKQNVLGPVVITINLDSLKFEKQVFLYVDSKKFSPTSTTPYTFKFDTRNFESGLHQISILVYGGDLGLLNNFDVPSHTFFSQLTFNNSPPSPITITSITWKEGHPYIEWEKDHDILFKAYYIHLPASRIDTIYDQSVSCYYDTLSQYYWDNCYYGYKIQATNAYFSSSASTSIGHTGSKIYISSQNTQNDNNIIYRPIPDMLSNIMYFIDGYTINALSTDDHSLYHSYYGDKIRSIALHPNSQIIYSLGDHPYGVAIRSYSTISSTELKFYNIPELPYDLPNHMCVSNNQKVFLRGSKDNNQLYQYNTSLTDFQQLNNVEWSPNMVMAVNGNILFVPKGNLLHVLDVSGDEPSIIKTINTSWPGPDDLKVQPGRQGQFFYIGTSKNTIEQWHVSSLTLNRTIELPVSSEDDYMVDFYMGKEKIYASFNSSGAEQTIGYITAYDFNQNKELRKWDFQYHQFLLATSYDEKVLYAIRATKRYNNCYYINLEE